MFKLIIQGSQRTKVQGQEHTVKILFPINDWCFGQEYHYGSAIEPSCLQRAEGSVSKNQTGEPSFSSMGCADCFSLCSSHFFLTD